MNALLRSLPLLSLAFVLVTSATAAQPRFEKRVLYRQIFLRRHQQRRLQSRRQCRYRRRTVLVRRPGFYDEARVLSREGVSDEAIADGFAVQLRLGFQRAMAGRTSSCSGACICTRRFGTRIRRAASGHVAEAFRLRAREGRVAALPRCGRRRHILSSSLIGRTAGASSSPIGTHRRSRGISRPSPRRENGISFITAPASAM